MKMWKTKTRLHTLAVLTGLASECGPAFGSNEISPPTSDSVEAATSAVQSDTTATTSTGSNSTALFLTSLVAT
ncbi:hypothetical protein JG687_00012227 [Phytophthora cactorum]|uniref:RxLR effector protein n=1 Tax=Phytophthora cactorum TaxID=29920 RepID=A0A329RUL3_9STRA|nr:hypothetical protein Pcac1_g27188 [Phytophthora cactorum]KAG2813892.1 hypothetical protein PC111_g14206 [Phytophthora cactorum]KAG2823915.1 hypothetical protein PC112_g10320 [Phytophthora cactorum]KAG2849666.1 hypothetical protein PC113_g17361 [Phytophthora cactorum]KAG2908447.1 hypothetical protein PC114_g10478 [Phytophthora cactorum]